MDEPLFAALARRGSREARLASTSLTFMLVCVPEPVCQTASGNSSSMPAREHLVGRGDDRVRLLRRQHAELGVDARRRALDDQRARGSARAASSPSRCGRSSSERCVCAPQSRSAGTSIGPKRVALDAHCGHLAICAAPVDGARVCSIDSYAGAGRCAPRTCVPLAPARWRKASA